jgi:hypothetical protein
MTVQLHMGTIYRIARQQKGFITAMTLAILLIGQNTSDVALINEFANLAIWPLGITVPDYSDRVA